MNRCEEGPPTAQRMNKEIIETGVTYSDRRRDGVTRVLLGEVLKQAKTVGASILLCDLQRVKESASPSVASYFAEVGRIEFVAAVALVEQEDACEGTVGDTEFIYDTLWLINDPCTSNLRH